MNIIILILLRAPPLPLRCNIFLRILPATEGGGLYIINNCLLSAEFAARTSANGLVDENVFVAVPESKSNVFERGLALPSAATR